ncbi:MAG: hypothetical protein HKN43_03780 [Rhodothermales bacterium]|nr:hypothetical protein [Rhodothermales bacterium]
MKTRYKFFVALMVATSAPFLAGGIWLEIVAVSKAFDGDGISVLSYMLLGMALVAIGVAIPVIALRTARTGTRFEDLKEAHPQEPWFWRDDWTRQLLRSGSEFPSGAVLVCLLWNCAMIGLGLLLYRQWLIEDDPFKWSVLIIPFIGVVLTLYAVRSVLGWLRFGESRFVLATLPVPAADLVEGIVYTEIHPDDVPRHGFRVSLSCINEKVRIDRKARTTRSYLLWRDEQRFKSANNLEDPDKVVIPLYFRLPEDCTETSMQTNNRVTWKLEISGKTGRGEYFSAFTLPVFRDHRFDARFVDWADCPSQLPARYSPNLVKQMPEIIGTGIEVDSTRDDSTILHLARARNRALAVLVGLITVVWWTMTAMLFVREAPLMFSALCAAGGMLALYGSIVMLTYESTITVRRDGIEYRRGPFGRGPLKTISGRDVDEVEVVTGSRAGTGYLHNIVVTTRSGEAQVIADLINDRGIANWLSFKIQSELFGYSPEYSADDYRTPRSDRDVVRRISNLNDTIGNRISTVQPAVN